VQARIPTFGWGFFALLNDVSMFLQSVIANETAVDLVHMQTYFRCSRVRLTDRSKNDGLQVRLCFWLFSVRFESP
jgi:hypothetical protein